MPSSGVLGNKDRSGNTPRAPIPKSTSLLQLSSGPKDGRCVGPAAGRAAARRRDEGHGGKEQGTAEQLPHNEPPGKSDGRRADQKPHIAKGGPAICQDSSTRSATIRTASPPPPPPPPPP